MVEKLTREEALEKEVKILRDTVDLMELAIEDWKALPPGEHFEPVSMIEALSRVEAAMVYEKRMMAWLEPGRAADKEKPRL